MLGSDCCGSASLLDALCGSSNDDMVNTPKFLRKKQEIAAPGATLSGAAPRPFDETYTVGQKLAKGSFGTVFVTTHKGSHEEFAVKVIDKPRLKPRDVDTLHREVGILKDCHDVDHIVRLVDFYDTPDKFFVVQVYARGGDVFERLAQRTSYSEKEARDLAICLLDAMKVLHERKIAHRDLKPENLLLEDVLSDSGILLADFGFASYVPEGGLRTRCGTPAFVAPEVIVQDCHYDERVDMWSVGCLLYMLIGGYPPFQDQNHRGLFRKIKGADYCFHDAYWKNVSIPAKQLISSLLTTDPDYRCTAAMALEQSSWLKLEDRRLSDNDLSDSLTEIKKFHSKRLLKSAVHAVMWSVRTKFKTTNQELPKQIQEWDEQDEKQNTSADKPLKTDVRPTLKFHEAYTMGPELHKSNAAVIHQCINRETNEVFAVKMFDRRNDKSKSALGKSIAETVLHEVAVLKALKHQHVIEIVDFFDEADFFYLVMELMEGGDVFDRIIQMKQYTEKDARDLARILLEGVQHLHAQGVAHRDLKPQNLLLKSKDDNATIKLADFGFACKVHTPQSLTTRCGTPTYVAPEILKNIPYDQSVDMWSVGVILYVLLCGYPPFSDPNQGALFSKIRTGEWEFVADDWAHVSDDAKDLIRQLLVVDPVRRLTATKALETSWLQVNDEELKRKDLSGSLEEMKRRKPTLKGVARGIMWAAKAAAVQKAAREDPESADLNDSKQAQRIII